MSSRSDIQCSSKRMKKKAQSKKFHKMFELENSSHSQSRNILELVKRNILMCHQTKTTSLVEPPVVKFPQVDNRLQEPQREPFTDQKNIFYAESRYAAFECSSITKQLLRKSILEKRKEKILHESQSREKFINYNLWRPW